MTVASKAIESFIAMREVEGKKLAEDIMNRTNFILDKVAFIEKESPETVKAYRERLENKVKELLELMGKVDVEENFIGTRWSKLLINAAFSGMSAVLGCTFGEAAGPKESRRIVQALIKECIDVCKVGGIRIEPVQGKDIVKLLDYKNPLKKAFSFFIIPIAIRKHAKLKASMLQDLEKGKLTEVDAINGAVSQYGRMVGCHTPMNDRVVEIIHNIEECKLQPSFDNLTYFNT
jgi:2-dehydropantoate 2-reductase